MAICTVFVIAGQSAATLLARLYYDKGGKSKWLGALVQLAGFPILLPYYFFPTKTTNPTTNISTSTTTESKEPSTLILASIYVTLGLLIALGCFLYSVGISYLPISTYSLISVHPDWHSTGYSPSPSTRKSSTLTLSMP